MSDEFLRVKQAFPKLAGSSSRATSPRSNSYNCVAWALGHDDRWLEPSATDEFPENFYGVNYPVEVLVGAFQKRGYVLCSEFGLEIGFEKIAIFGKEGEWTHAARQLDNGLWTSKLGKGIDIEYELFALECDAYGKVQALMKRDAFEAGDP